MAGRYRALLIGNSTYPADEHNLQTLKGPVKDIAVLNRALADRDTGLFADVDVTLLPEATSARAVRALGTFFTTADRDDVLLVYFSGHGKLDQMGRLHLCMHDTETTDLLSTAVSSVRINEFADASRARNVVIILDCCYAGAFRGGDFGDAVAGPGRYVMTSCRGTQLANDATVDNGTSFFTQHLVEGLLDAADQDGDGYVSFSDLYAYVDRCLREDGKQIPQRRVDGDGDLRLARRPPRAVTVAGSEGPTAARTTNGAGSDVPPPRVGDVASPLPQPPASATRRRRGWTRRRSWIIAAVVAGVIAAGVAAGLLLLPASNPSDHATPGSGSYTASAPWRLRIDGTVYGQGCTVTLTETTPGATTTIPLPGNLYHVAQYQLHQTGSFRWQTTDQRCLITPFAGSGTQVLPFTQVEDGETDAFPAPARGLVVQVKDNVGGDCALRLFDATNGQELDVVKWSPGMGAVTLNTKGRTQVYLYDDNCVIQVSAHP